MINTRRLLPILMIAFYRHHHFGVSPFVVRSTVALLGRKVLRPSSTSIKATTSSDVPLVFLHGIKGSHLVGREDGKRRWLGLEGLLNFPPLPDGHPERDLSLPLGYTNAGVQQAGDLAVDGLVEYIIQFSGLEFVPFYGHVMALLNKLDQKYQYNQTSSTETNNDHHHPSRPTAIFAYDWRRNLHDLTDEFQTFCDQQFPGQPVQVLAHSMGGLIAFKAMRQTPQKYSPGAVMVGVPFGTGTQYLEDMHRGYFSELGRCRQFLPACQFSFSSHWVFFPASREQQENCFVDVTDNKEFSSSFSPGKSAIGKGVGGFQLDAVPGQNVDIDFYNVDSWEENRLGVFDMKHLSEELLNQYRNHMKIQLASALDFRNTVLVPPRENEWIPPLSIMASDTVPTVNQILRRKNGESYEYDFGSGRRVPGDGRVYFSGAFPPVPHKKMALNSVHAKQFRCQADGGSLETIMSQVTQQLEEYTQGR